MATVTYRRQVELRYSPDVLVVGGGPAGGAAATAAARTGARVLLVEAQGVLGGLGTSGLVPAFMTFGDYGDVFLADGIGREVLDAMNARCDAHTAGAPPYSIKLEALKRAYDDMVLGAGVELVLFAQLIDVEVQGGQVRRAVFASKSGLWAVEARAFIDATGDGDLCAWAGAPFEKGDARGNVMASTLCSLWAGVDWARVSGPDSRALEQAYEDGVFEQLDLHLPGMWKISDSIGGGNIGHVYDVDGTDERSLTRAMIEGRKLVERYEKYYKRYLTGYENMQLVTTANVVGLRESRRIMGDYVINIDDFRARRDFDDEIGRYCYPVDIHASNVSKQAFDEFHKDHTTLRYGHGESYGVPYRILLPQKLENVWVTGRCVSADRPMQSSLRVMPGCFITGQAAGAAAALAARGDARSRAVDMGALRGALKALGAYLRA